MADDTQTIVLVAMAIALSVLGLFELRFLRKRRQHHETKEDLPDRAHNAVITVKAIADTLARGGVRSAEADGLVREAEDAIRERNFRVAIEFTEKAKSVLRTAKLKQHRQGDLSKIDSIRAKGEADEVTAKERLMKDLPPNYMQSKFSMSMARDEIAAATANGKDATEAESILARAQTSFDAKDYAAALREAVRARRSLEEAPSAPTTPSSPPDASAVSAPATTRPCPSCGAPVPADDGFCRKCGVAMPKPRTCSSCGAPVADDDPFCRKCGTRVPLTVGNP